MPRLPFVFLAACASLAAAATIATLTATFAALTTFATLTALATGGALGDGFLASMLGDNIHEFINLMDANGELVFSDRQAHRMERAMANMEFVLRWKQRWQEVATALDADVEMLDDERAYQPAAIDVRGGLLSLPEAERGDTPLAELPSFAETWAHGFLHAVQTFADDWAPPRDREASEMLDDAIADIEDLTRPDTDPPVLSMHSEDGPPSVSQRRIDQYGSALWGVYELRKLWKSMGPRVVAVRKAPEPGRNDPCPCGSGKKFKKCHGA